MLNLIIFLGAAGIIIVFTKITFCKFVNNISLSYLKFAIKIIVKFTAEFPIIKILNKIS